MKHLNQSAPAGELDRLRALRDKAPEGRYACAACEDHGVIYFARTPYGHPAIGVAPCTECERGAARHLDGAACVWARGSRPCPLCGAYEGEQVPAGWRPEAPHGWMPYSDLGAYGR